MTAPPPAPDLTCFETPRIRLLGLGVLIALSVYLLVVLGIGIDRTEHLEQDSANYVEVTERWLSGQGLTSLSDRRGPADPVPFPQPFRASNAWPWVLGSVAYITGEVRVTGMILSLLSLIGALIVGSWTVRRGVLGTDGRVPWLFCVLAVAAAVCHKRSVSNAILPMSDCFSLFLNVSLIAVLIARRHAVMVALAVALVVVACLARYQNCALLFPLAYGLTTQWPKCRRAVLGLGLVVGIVFVGPRLFEALWVFINPADGESLIRTIRWLAPPTLVGLWLMRRGSGLGVFLWLGAGHLLVLMSNYDASDRHHWLFGIRHGWPLHFVAAALAAFALARSKGWFRILLFACVAIAAVDNVRKTWRIMVERTERTSLGNLEPMIASLRENPLEPGSIVLSYQSDILAAELGVPSVHLRGWDPEDVTFVDCVRRQHLTHVLLTWSHLRVMERSNDWMTAMERILLPHMVVERNFVLADGISRSVLLRWSD